MLGWSSQLGNKLFGQDPKLEFRKPGQGADLLAGPVAFDIEDPYWTQYLTLFDAPSESLYLLPTSLLLRTLHQNPTNLLTLLSFTTSHLFSFLSSPQPLSEKAIGECLSCIRVLTRLMPLLLGPQTDARVRDRVEEQVFWKRERVTKPSSQEPKKGAEETEREEGQFVLEDEEDEDDETNQETPKPSSSFEPSTSSTTQQQQQEEESEELPCLAERLISTLIHLLFVPSLTLSSDLSTPSSLVNYSIWEPGIASPPSPFPSPSTSPQLLSNRSEIFKLLTLIISLPSLLTPPNLFPSVPNRFRQVLVDGTALKGKGKGGQGEEEKKVILCLLCSAINTVCSSNPRDEGPGSPGGGGLAEGAKRFALEAAKRSRDVTLGNNPSITAGGGDPKDELIGNCLQFLSVVLMPHAPTGGGGGTTNLFEFYFSKLHRREDFELLFGGLLAQVYSTLVPSSTGSLLPINFSLPIPGGQKNEDSTIGGGGARKKSSRWIVESFTVLWRLVEGNKKFLKWVLISTREGGGMSRLGELMTLLEIVRNEWKGDETQIGLVRLCSFLLQTITAEAAALGSSLPEYAHELKRVLSTSIVEADGGGRLATLVKRQSGILGIPLESLNTLTLIEFLITSAHSLILSPSTNKSGRLSTLYPSIILSIDNLSPFIVGLGLEASTRLTRIWLAFSAPSWVLMEEGNPRLIYYLLETFNNILYSNLSSNPQLLYSILLTKKRFELLSQFTLEIGVSEARRLRSERRKKRQEQQQQQSSLEPVHEDRPLLSSPRASIVSPSRLSVSSQGGGEEEAVSEKVAGKRRERSLSSTLGTQGFNMSELSLSEPGANTVEEEGPFVGKNGFVPTEQWVSSWREGLPLDPILLMISEFSPQLATSPTRTQSLQLLTTLIPSLPSLLPPAQPPKPRRFLLNEPLQTWLASTVYGKIYLTDLEYLRETLPVQLFGVQHGTSSHGSGRMGGLGIAGLGLDGVGRTVEEVGGRVGEFAKGIFGRVGGGAR